jgi:hypothetical protein
MFPIESIITCGVQCTHFFPHIVAVTATPSELVEVSKVWCVKAQKARQWFCPPLAVVNAVPFEVS